MIVTFAIVGTSTEMIGIARPRVIVIRIANETVTVIGIAIGTATREATIGTITERITAAVVATGTVTSGTNTSVAVVADMEAVTIGIDLRSMTGTEIGTGTVGDKVFVADENPLGCFFLYQVTNMPF